MGLEKFGVPEGGLFKTNATTLKKFWKDAHDFVLGFRRSQGKAPATVGVNRPSGRGNIESLQDLEKEALKWQQEQKTRLGGFALDAHNTHPSDSYRQRRFDFVSREEGVRRRAYDDATGQSIRFGENTKGRVTVGVGFNMDAPGNREQFKEVLDADDEFFNKVYSGQALLSDEQVRKLFDDTIREAEQIVQDKFGDLDLEEHERLALVSLAFNNPNLIGPNLTRHIRNGNKKDALDEILYRSNASGDDGLASRRWREGAMFIGPVNSEAALPEYEEYAANYR